MDYERNLHSHISYVKHLKMNSASSVCKIKSIFICDSGCWANMKEKRTFGMWKILRFVNGVTLKEVCFTGFEQKMCRKKHTSMYVSSLEQSTDVSNIRTYKTSMYAMQNCTIRRTKQGSISEWVIKYYKLPFNFNSRSFFLWFLWIYRHGMHWWQTACKWQQSMVLAISFCSWANWRLDSFVDWQAF